MQASLYIHFPFCVRKCLYCDFNSVGGDAMAPRDYVSLLLKEMELRRSRLPAEVTAPTLYLGGGTPSLMAPDLVREIVDAARRLFGVEEDAEITMEGNPGTVSLETLRGYRSAGVNRLSLGVQSFDDRFLAVLGRVHSAREAADAIEAAREAGFRNLSIDLMHSLPGQSLEEWHDTLRRALSFAPEHISAYALIVEPGTPFEGMDERGELPLPDEEEGARMFESTGEILAAAGYLQYEISNFARPGYQSRHNTVYWRRGSYLGFGAGAHSFLNRGGTGTRWSNARGIAEYGDAVASGRLPEEEMHELTVREAISEGFFLGLRRLDGVDLAELSAIFRAEDLQPFLAQAESLVASGALQREGSRVRLAPAAVAVANSVFCRFL
ncbi:radical SAM family heme chaperone HemW [Geomonas sp. RF6]|uniref:radical SAM family heme chaperone HemW n=1 Tax=Geomonas sp. RF6 TaxID=2897342 RepID=UPI001E64EB2D|nr:radical SAM family heme chaperone HemW [Geomonas sp. RF6]UFS71823.1 radical SAM family heme chaperone HemW [Geomonas sp. RF6]